MDRSASAAAPNRGVSPSERHDRDEDIESKSVAPDYPDRTVMRAGPGNQPTLHEGIVGFFLDHIEDDFARVKVSRHETKEHGHGRDEHRTYYVCDVPDDLPDRVRWKGLKRIGVAISDTVRGGKSCDDVRYYILSKKLSARSFGAAVRGHWGIENSLHWQLDMSFGEDRSRIRKGHADANFAVVRRMALSLLKNERSQKVGVKTKRLTAGWNDDYLEQVLFGTALLHEGLRGLSGLRYTEAIVQTCPPAP